MEEEANELEFGGGASSIGIGSPGQSQEQLDAIKSGFENTIYTITTANCAGCHRVGGLYGDLPHGDPDSQVAMDALVNGGFIDFENPLASPLWLKVRTGAHGNCTGSCATDFPNFIEQWVAVVQANQGSGSSVNTGNGNNNSGEPSDCVPEDIPLVVTTGGGASGGTGLTRRQAFDSFMYPVMVNQTICGNCHMGTNPRHSNADANVAYAAWESYNGAPLYDFNNIDNSFILEELMTNHRNLGNATETENRQTIRAAIIQWRDNIDPNAGQNNEVTVIERVYPSCNAKNVPTDSMNSLANANQQEEQVSGGTFTRDQAMLVPPLTNNGMYIANPNAHALYPVTMANVGKAQYQFEVFQRGNYEVVAEVAAADGATDSWYVAITPDCNPADNAATYTEWRFGATNNQLTVMPVRDFNNGNAIRLWDLPVGNHCLTIKERENFARLNTVVVRMQGEDNPVTVNEFTELQFDLSEALDVDGAMLTFRVEDFDATSYKISNLRMVNAQNAYVKDLEIAINGLFLPENATFKLLDHLVLSNDEEITPYTMIIAKDRGMGDQPKWQEDSDGNLVLDGDGNPVQEVINGEPQFLPADEVSVRFGTLVMTEDPPNN